MREQIQKLIDVCIADYNRFLPENHEMREEFANGFEIVEGRKYIKIINRNSVWGFIVNTDTDKKFKKGDILKPAGWNAPTRNKARGNIVDGGYNVRWTGPEYLR